MGSLLCGRKSRNIAFYLGTFQDKEIGGGYVFQKNVVDELIKYDFESIVYLYYESNENLFTDTKNLKFIN